jgi:hypothetical protein
MAATSESGKLSEAVASWLAATYAWDTAPAPGWLVDFEDRSDLVGLGAIAIATARPIERVSRGGLRGRGSLSISVYKPIGSGNNFEAGDLVVKRSEDVTREIMGLRVTAVPGETRRCVEAEMDPVLSQDAMRQYRLFLSFIRTEWA